MNKHVSTKEAPAAIGPYSQAVIAGNTLYISGMMPIAPATGKLGEADIAAQTKQILKNIDAVLKEAGYSSQDVIKTTCYIHDMSDFAVFNEVYASYFKSCPARSCVAVKELPKGALAEIETIAYK